MLINSIIPSLSVQRCDASCGALVRGVDLTRALEPGTVAAIRQAWLDHQVIAFPDQALSVEDLERFAHYMGPFGEDPYIEAIPGHPHVVQVKREPDEQTKIFAEAWHSDWSFLPTPPAGTVLFGNIIPPVGGNTLFANQYDAWDALPDAMQSRLKGKMGVHSARRGYASDGAYGEQDRSAGRSMAIRFDDAALKTRSHPIARVHPETGHTALFVSPGYTISIEDTAPAEVEELLLTLFDHQRRPEFVYNHAWSANMLVMWDNRSLVHAATGGYEGHRRLLHRVTISEKAEASEN